MPWRSRSRVGIGPLAGLLPSWYVYSMRMARVNVYLPDDLADEVRASGINVSQVTQEALRAVLSPIRTDSWLDDVRRLGPTGVSSEDVAAAVTSAKEDLERGRG